jgi:hypothetical protein
MCIVDELLPLIHQIWPSFNACFADEEKLVTVKVSIILNHCTSQKKKTYLPEHSSATASFKQFTSTGYLHFCKELITYVYARVEVQCE